MTIKVRKLVPLAVNYFLNFLFLAVSFLPLDTVNLSGGIGTPVEMWAGVGHRPLTRRYPTPRETNIHAHENQAKVGLLS